MRNQFWLFFFKNLSSNVFHNLYAKVSILNAYSYSLERHDWIVPHAKRLMVAQSFSSTSSGFFSLMAISSSCWNIASSTSPYHILKCPVLSNIFIINREFDIIVLDNTEKDIDVVVVSAFPLARTPVAILTKK